MRTLSVRLSASTELSSTSDFQLIWRLVTPRASDTSPSLPLMMLRPVPILLAVPSDLTMLHLSQIVVMVVAVEVDVADEVDSVTVEDAVVDVVVADLVIVEDEEVVVEVDVVEAPTEVASVTSRARSRLSKSGMYEDCMPVNIAAHILLLEKGC